MKKLTITSALIALCVCSVAMADTIPAPKLSLTLNQNMLDILHNVAANDEFTTKTDVVYLANKWGTGSITDSVKSAAMGAASYDDLKSMYAGVAASLQQGLGTDKFPYDGIEKVAFQYAVKGTGVQVQCTPTEFQPPYGSQTFTQVDIQINANADGSCEVIAKGS